MTLNYVPLKAKPIFILLMQLKYKLFSNCLLLPTTFFVNKNEQYDVVYLDQINISENLKETQEESSEIKNT